MKETEAVGEVESPLRRLAKSRSFIALFVASSLSFGGEQMRLAAQSWWILDEGGSSSIMGVAAGLRIIPVVALTLYGGVLIDRFGGKRILIAERSILVLLALVTALVLLLDQAEIWHIVVLSTVAGATIALGVPSTQSTVPEVVPPDLLQPANSMNQLGNALGRTLGGLLAGILTALRGAAFAFFGLAVVYGTSLLITFGIRTRPDQRTRPTESATRQIINGLSYIRSNPILLWTIVMAISEIPQGMLFPIIPVYAREVLEVGELKFGWMWGAIALGQGSGALFIASRGGFANKARTIIIGEAIFVVAFIAFGLSTNYWLSLVFLFVSGFTFPMLVSSWVTLLQNHSKSEFRGRVFAVYWIAMQGVSVSWILGGFLLDTIGNFPTVLFAALTGGLVIAIPFIVSKNLRQV